MPRLFIAVKLDAAIQEQLAKIQTELQRFDLGVRWVLPENIHLTLRFLGAVDEKTIPDLLEILKAVSRKHKSGRMGLKTIGAFPTDQHPRVIWIGVEEKTGELRQIYLELENALSGVGFEKDDHSFSPHITLGRVKSPKNIESLKQYLRDQKNITIGSQPAAGITLFRSDLKPSGPVYHEEANFQFQSRQDGN
ncbi:MAG: RNA 2',3'-cyclic phosphodiesterase [Planctomycetota bacterium]